MKTITFGGGCFWCTQAVFSKLKGITKITAGYAGGSTEEPTYEDICKGNTGHAEVIQIEFDDSALPLDLLLEVFFHVHDPTTLNAQGADKGTQYRSVIFYHNNEQKKASLKKITEISNRKVWDDKLVTEVTGLGKFYSAEEYHQKYFENNPTQGYCLATIPPKLEKLKKIFPELLWDGGKIRSVGNS